MVNLISLLFSKNRKVIIGVLILVVLLGLLFLVSLFSRLRNQQITNQANQTTAPTATTLSIYSTTPANNEKGVPINTNIVITFNETVQLADFSFSINPALDLKATQPTNNTLELQNSNGFKSNQKYDFKVTLKNENLIFNSQAKTYSFSFTTGNYNLRDAIRGSVK